MKALKFSFVALVVCGAISVQAQTRRSPTTLPAPKAAIELNKKRHEQEVLKFFMDCQDQGKRQCCNAAGGEWQSGAAGGDVRVGSCINPVDSDSFNRCLDRLFQSCATITDRVFAPYV